MKITVHQGDALVVLKTLPAKSVHCVVTSPPYWGLRDYGIAGQLGLERTLEEYVEKIVEVCKEVSRVLRDDGTLWLNLGDCYASSGGSGWQGKNGQRATRRFTPPHFTGKSAEASDLKPKDLCGVPWRVALALQQPYVMPTIVKAETDRAWLAAMFDGEGCIGIRRFDSYRKEKQQVYQDGFVVYTVVTNNDTALLERCAAITGLGKPHLKQAAGSTDRRGIQSRRDSYGWRLDGTGAVDIVRAIYPYLIAKKKQACLAYTLDCLNKNGHGSHAVPQDIQEKKRFLWELIKKCNQREAVDIPSWVEEPKQEIRPSWYLRSDIIWSKPNPMPESATDRPTKAHEYIFLLTKSERYFYDQEAVREPPARLWDESTGGSWAYEKGDAARIAERGKAGTHSGAYLLPNPAGHNLRSVWTIVTGAFSQAHFATFPTAIVERCIKAGTSEKGCCPQCLTPWGRIVERKFYGDARKGLREQDLVTGKNVWRGIQEIEGGYVQPQTIGWRPLCSCPESESIPCLVLDPFAGAGTTLLVADRLGRNGIGIELNPDYVAMTERRLVNDAPLFIEVEKAIVEPEQPVLLTEK